MKKNIKAAAAGAGGGRGRCQNRQLTNLALGAQPNAQTVLNSTHGTLLCRSQRPQEREATGKGHLGIPARQEPDTGSWALVPGAWILGPADDQGAFTVPQTAAGVPRAEITPAATVAITVTMHCLSPGADPRQGEGGRGGGAVVAPVVRGVRRVGGTVCP
ncbi:hypothetical protein AAFF_G00077520 [Aldrovandia affinis]|uniref:Uncharacterized protein n=1 Tax=Aldrovandia affinis TaxID=143900 RepID=A0AAD7RXF5_9TELE|nr:hypothetical protein AAFF_G00077520 [Aldrovandia affinis]